MSKKKKRIKTVYEQVDNANANVDISKKNMELIVDISPDLTVPEDERIVIVHFDGDPNIIPENDVIFLNHETNNDLKIDKVKFEQATNRNRTKVDLKVLKKCSKDKNKNIRAATARSPFISGDILHTLSQSKSKYIRESVASNNYGNLKKKTIRLLMKDKDMYVRNTLSSNSCLSPELINRFLITEKQDMLIMCNLMYLINTRKG
jgi:hypothetical protein